MLCAAFSPDGHRAISGGDDGAVVLWNLDGKKMIRRLQGPRDLVRCVAFLPTAATHSGERRRGDSSSGTSQMSARSIVSTPTRGG